MQRVVGGKHSVIILDRNIRDVMKVASPFFRPRSAERPRRNGGLIPARTHNRFEREPVDPFAGVSVRNVHSILFQYSLNPTKFIRTEPEISRQRH